MSRFAPKTTAKPGDDFVRDTYEHGFSYSTDSYKHISKPGLSEGVVREISKLKNEPDWMLEFRLKALKQFFDKKMPNWGADLSGIDFEKICYYMRPTDDVSGSWDDVPDDVKLTFEKLGVPEAEREVLAGLKAQYDCLTADSMVFTSEGVRKIINIKSGEMVFSLNENTGLFETQKVIGLENKGKRQIYKVKTSGGREIKVTKNHPFYNLEYIREKGKKRGRYKKAWKYLSDLKKGDLIALAVDIPQYGKSYSLPKIIKPKLSVKSRNQFVDYDLDISKRYKDLKFPKETNKDLMWLLGFYLGDGFLAGNTSKSGKKRYSRVELAIPKSEKNLRKEVSRIVKELFSYDILQKAKDRVTLNSILFVQLIEKLDLSGLAHTKQIPNWVYFLPKDQKLSFIGGYFDADGGIRKDSPHSLVFTSVSNDLLKGLKLLAISCGLNTSHVWEFSSKQKYKGQILERKGFRIQLSGDILIVDSRMERKRRLFIGKKYIHRFKTAKGTDFRCHTSDHIGFTKILSIEKLGIEEVYDIEVDGHHNFIANGLVVHNSEVVYGSLKEAWAKDGVIFLSMDEGLAKYPDLVKEYFGKVIASGDNKFSALNTAVWSGGSFVYVPPGVDVKMPLQTYFRINAENMGQFERTLIIVDEGAKVHYLEGCTAPSFSSSSLHSAVVEIFVKKGATCQYTTVQNWYKNIYNLVTKRSYVEEDATMIWTDFNMGSKVTMKYPGFVLAGRGAHGEVLSMALAGEGQHQDTGAKAIHLAPDTSSTIISKSISKGGGRASYRGMVHIGPHARNSKNTVVCDALLLDPESQSDTYPVERVFNNRVEVQHEATVSKIGDDQLFYLMTRGISEEDARKMIVNGFIADLVKKLPLEYAVEMNRLIDFEMEGSIG